MNIDVYKIALYLACRDMVYTEEITESGVAVYMDYHTYPKKWLEKSMDELNIPESERDSYYFQVIE